MKLKKNKLINQVCLTCGNKNRTKDKRVFGVWIGICDMCGKEASVADAAHDFGIYSNKQIESWDKYQDKL